jgi:hypothetical protein
MTWGCLAVFTLKRTVLAAVCVVRRYRLTRQRWSSSVSTSERNAMTWSPRAVVFSSSWIPSIRVLFSVRLESTCCEDNNTLEITDGSKKTDSGRQSRSC